MIETLQTLGGLAFAAVILYVVFVLPAKRRARMTPAEREVHDLQRRVRRVERKQAWRS